MTENVKIREKDGRRTIEVETAEDRPVRVIETRREAPREVVEEDRTWVLREMLHKGTRLIWLFSGSLQALIGLRVLLKALAANPANVFAQFVYGITELFVRPFEGLTVTPAFDGIVLEIHSIIAIFVYALFTWGLVELLWILFGQYTSRRRTTIVRQ